MTVKFAYEQLVDSARIRDLWHYSLRTATGTIHSIPGPSLPCPAEQGLSG